jgi:hypothetical protein
VTTARIANIFLEKGERIVGEVREPVIKLFVMDPKRGRYVKAELGPEEVAQLHREFSNFLHDVEALTKEQIREIAEELEETMPGYFRRQSEHNLKRLEQRLKEVQEVLGVDKS